MDIKLNFSKKNIINLISAGVLFIMILILFLAIGMRYWISGQELVISGYGSNGTLNEFKGASNAAHGKDIYGASAAIIAFSVFFLVSAGASFFIGETKIMWRLGLYILNYLLVFLIFILSIVILAEFIQSAKYFTFGFFNQKASASGLSIAFIIIIGWILPLVAMYLMFNKILFKALTKLK